MKLKNSEEVEAFLAAVDRCRGEVYLMSADGDKLNLKSMISRYVSMGKLLSENGDKLELFCDCKDDEHHFFRFFREHPEVNQ